MRSTAGYNGSTCPNAVGSPTTIGANGTCNAAVDSNHLAVFSCPSDPGDPYEEDDSGNGPYYGIGPSFPTMVNGVECKGAKTNYDFSTYCDSNGSHPGVTIFDELTWTGATVSAT